MNNRRKTETEWNQWLIGEFFEVNIDLIILYLEPQCVRRYYMTGLLPVMWIQDFTTFATDEKTI